METGVEFVAVDFPQANRLTVHILAAVAELERELASQRTKAALAAHLGGGERLGNPNLTAASRTKGAVAGLAVRRAQAQARAADLRPLIAAIQAAGHSSLRAIAAELDGRGIPAPRRGRWSVVAVARVLGGSAASRPRACRGL